MKSLILAGAATVALAAPAFGQGAPAAPPRAAPGAAQSVSRVAIQQTDKERFTQMDSNKDGFVTAGELSAAAGPDQAARLVGSLDSNKDGKVSLAELDAMMLSMFDRADADRDGIVTVQEQAAMAAAASANAPAPRGN